MNRKTPLVLAVLVVGGFLAVGGVAATQDGQFDSTDVQPAQQGNLTFDDQATASSTFTDTTPSTPGVVVENVTADVDSAVVVTYPDPGLQAGDQVTVDLDNVGFSAWEVNGVGGDADSVDDVVVDDVDNPTLRLVEGVEYTFTGLPGDSNHPLEFFDSNNDALLSQSAEGSFESDPDVGWEDTDDTVTFTATGALLAELDGYICTFHSSMEGDVQTTNETTTDLVVAGVETFNASELVGGNVAVPVGDVGGFPGTHTAHLIPEANLSQDYGPGDVVSNETASAIITNEQATVYQGSLTFESQDTAGPIEEGDVLGTVTTANLFDGAGNDTEFVVDVHPTDDQGNLLAGEFVGASNVLSGTNTGVEIIAEQVPQDGEFNGFPLNGSNEYVAMVHLVDDGAQPGDPAVPSEYPLLAHASSTGFVTGGVTDNATVDAAQQATLTFDDQATASSTFTDTTPSTPGVVVGNVDAGVDSAVVVTYPDTGLQAGDQVTVDLDNVGSNAWEVNGVGGDADSVDDVVVNDVNNPTLSLVEGVEYTFTGLPSSNHPLALFSSGYYGDDALLSQSADGSFEDDPDVGWEDTGDTVTFTATGALLAELDGYKCTIHTSNMQGGVQTTTETTTDLVVAGVETFNASELVGGNVVVPVEDTGGFPGTHTAHLIPEANLSQDYGPGDVVSNETAGAIITNEQATVYQGSLTFESQDTAGPIEEGDVLGTVTTANLFDGAGNDTEFVVDVHPTDDQGNLLAGEFVGASNVLSGTNTGVEIIAEQVPQDGEFNGFPLNGSNEYVAMVHLVDDGAQPGDPAVPSEYPLLAHASSTGFVTGGVTDNATVDAVQQTLTFTNQSLDGETVEVGPVQTSDVESAVILTYESGGDLVVAGLTTGIFANESVAVDIEDTGGLPGEHTAHVVPVSGLSQDYETGDVVSSETVDAISDQATGTVSVSITGDPATDTTGDGRLNDLNGDGTFDIVDVQVLFDNLDSPTVQSNPLLFDFLGEGNDRVSIFDVQALFIQSREQSA